MMCQTQWGGHSCLCSLFPKDAKATGAKATLHGLVAVGCQGVEPTFPAAPGPLIGEQRSVLSVQ